MAAGPVGRKEVGGLKSEVGKYNGFILPASDLRPQIFPYEKTFVYRFNEYRPGGGHGKGL